MERRILRDALLSEGSSAEGHQLICDFEEELVLDREDCGDMEALEAVDITAYSSNGPKGVGRDEDERIEPIYGSGKRGSTAHNGVEEM